MKAKYIYQIGAFLLGSLIFSGCVEWPEFEALDLASAPTVTVAQTNVGDSTITVDVTSSANGFVAAILLPGTGNAVPGDSAAILEGNVEYLAYASGEVEANTPVSFTFTADIVQDADYEVMAVAANEDGVVSSPSVITVTTTDNYPPGLLGTTPAFTYDPVVELDGQIVMFFDEPVQKGSGSFTFETFYAGATIPVPDDSVSAVGNEIIINMPMMPDYGDYLWLHWEADAVTDFSGNGVAALTTILDGGAFVGAYWRLVHMTMTYASLTPDPAAASLDAGADITVTFGDVVRASGYETGDMTLYYETIVNDSTVNSTTISVAAENVSTSGNDLVIGQLYVAAGGTVTLIIPEGVLTVGPGRNPVEAIEETWDIMPIVK